MLVGWMLVRSVMCGVPCMHFLNAQHFRVLLLTCYKVPRLQYGLHNLISLLFCLFSEMKCGVVL